MTYLTKTTYLHARQCRKRFWLGRFDPRRGGELGPSHRFAIEQGQAVGRLAQAQFPDGVLIEGHGETALRRTRRALAAGAPAVFEAAFLAAGVLIRCDILARAPGNRWRLIEVKSSTRIRDHYLHDAAIQAHVLAATGIDLQAIEIMYINSQDCVYPDLSNLFRRADVTAPVKALLTDLPGTLQELHAVLEQDQAPDIAIGRHCTAPHPCPFQGRCWAGVPEASIFTIPRLSEDKLNLLIQRGVLDLREIPDDFPLTKSQWAYVRFVRRNRTRFNRKGIRAALAELEYPLYFFDFETYGPAVPELAGLRPYQNYPFQYSCHILHADGRLEHREYLHRNTRDPRPELAKQLCRDLGRRGAIVAYNAAFERGVLRSLAAALPKRKSALQAIERRLWDQLALMRRYVDHPRFLNSKSIKRVLPVLAPDLGYDDLAVQRGDEAQIAWRRMLATDDAEERSRLDRDLRAYCARDTLAMVRIHEVLEKLAQR